MAKAKVDWVLPGGKPGEIGYCTRCGRGLCINLPQPFEIATACMNAFVSIHSKCEPGKHFEKPAKSPEEWAAGRDTGTSSLTIYQAITGNPSHHRCLSIPYDPDDFGRCYRLLKLFPAWREQLPKVIEICPEWKPFVEAWDELTALFEAAGWHDRKQKPKGDDGKMYERMKQLREISDQQQIEVR